MSFLGIIFIFGYIIYFYLDSDAIENNYIFLDTDDSNFLIAKMATININSNLS